MSPLLASFSPATPTPSRPSRLIAPRLSSPSTSATSATMRRHSRAFPFAVGIGVATSLGSPFSMPDPLPSTSTADADLDFVDGIFAAVPHALTITRPASPDFSLLDLPPDADVGFDFDFDTGPWASGLGLGSASRLFGRRHHLSPAERPVRSIFPRLWDALCSPVKRVRGLGGSYHCKTRGAPDDWCALAPLDDDEGELIELVDDEACFVEAHAVTGLDFLSLLPTELAFHVLALLDLRSVLACAGVCHVWRALTQDNALWRALFARMYAERGWRVAEHWYRGRHCYVGGDEDAATRHDGWRRPSILTFMYEEWVRKRVSSQAQMSAMQRYGTMELLRASLLQRATQPTPMCTWKHLYKTRYILDQRWIAGPPSSPTATLEASDRSSGSGVLGGSTRVFEPAVTRLSGHADSVYCLEFDSRFIFTGSRDRSIKVWELHGGQCVGTFGGAGGEGEGGHRGSVLCLKFDREWWRRPAAMQTGESVGSMVSGSSDCCVCVWDLRLEEEAPADPEGRTASGAPTVVVTACVRRVLRHHSSGVLDLRMCDRWIVSCSKDALICVWRRDTLALHCTFRGHEGPVNAVGMEHGRVASASGDGKLMLWEIPEVVSGGGAAAESGAVTVGPTRVFEGHGRRFACIEFKDDLIVSGSNDRKIKVWRASTGECLRTLAGHDKLVRALSFDPRSGRLVSASYDRTVKVWDLWSGRMVREFHGCHASHIFDVKFDVGRIVSTSHDQMIVVLDFTRGLDVTPFV